MPKIAESLEEKGLYRRAATRWQGSLKAALSPYARRFPYQKALSTDGHGST
ncbi:TPA: PerC family transcriptional regulator [Klebsiella pneumoniae]